MGGAETFLMKIYRHLDRSRYQMDFCTNVNEKQFYEDEILSLGGRIFRVPCKSQDRVGFKEGLYRVVRDNGYKYVLRAVSNALGCWDVKIASDAGAKVCAVRSCTAGGCSGIREWAAHMLGRLIYLRWVNCKIAPSDLAAGFLFGRGALRRGEVNILRNGVDIDVFKYDERIRAEVRAEFGLNDRVKIVGHVGRLSPEKNHRYLLKAFAEFSKKEENAYLLLVGGGGMEQQLRETVSDLGIDRRVIFAGIRRDVPRLMSAMDVFAFPSFYEGMPNTVIEAQATGLPCVISDTITREANVTGMVRYLPIDESSIPAWAEAVNSALLMPRKNTRDDFVREGYEIGVVTEKFQKIIFEE